MMETTFGADAGSAGRSSAYAAEGRLRTSLDLVWTLVRTDFKARYHGSLNGFVWALLKPTCIFLVLMTVFSFLFPDPLYKLNLIVGLCLWDFFNEATKTGLASLDAKAFLIKKVRAPLWVLVLSSLANACLTFLVFTSSILAFLFLTGRMPSALNLLCFVGYALSLAIMVSAFSLAASVLFLRVRDLNQVWDVVAQAGFFVAPIIYPIGIVPERFHFYFYIWPPTPIIEFSRAVLVAGTTPTLTAHLYLLIEVIGCLAIGIITFRRYAPRAPEYV